MPKTRLFVGGLSEKVDEDALGSRLSRFGTVSGIDLKERTDADGNVMLKFSYVNIDAPSSKIDECIRQLNGCSWLGSQLRVEPAKESFLDRLSRERASIKQQQQESGHKEKIDKSPAITFTKPVKKDDSINVKRSLKDCEVENDASLEEGIKKKKKHKTSNRESNASEISVSEDAVPTVDAQEEKRKKKRRSTDHSSAAEPEQSMSAKCKSKKKHKAEEEMMSSFKKFSSVWADSDDDTNDQNKSNADVGDVMAGSDEGFFIDLEPDKLEPVASASKKARKKEKRDETNMRVGEHVNDGHNTGTVQDDHQAQVESLADLKASDGCFTNLKHDGAEGSISNKLLPSSQEQEAKQTMISEREEGKKYVKVDKDLNFGKSSSGFSLLAQFSQHISEERDESEREELLAPVVIPPRPKIVAQPRVKTKPFFLQPGDRQIEAAIVWMAQSLTNEVENEFAEVLPQLRSLYKTRSIRAMREERNLRSRGRGRGRGVKRGRGRSTGARVPYRDLRWREKRPSERIVQN
ncbi:uncharacterized protein [Procambarus clarkii]|uniref:uncharacterized protein n=1 Tax=Procambarus clarkii TaxID=6728 RepID=UPI001E671CDA|nr:probable RNA-binding protein CG14230 [Procambarus clarkii]XP_045587546.1 probable RNA-binding protein CG14230 [Procambarus clarkii]XP_045587549.1 probable RNA-binding protein CG14230 [Procambarus clarkii]XP_045587557.1 probable RNA-binding protein CG14230 [Procambarus clarkii]XP_045587562.1 probable RNA-binding protein CG14230 [Procambarus clarkii]XP_045587570.1 probable RNA-binding protein CG14230 [Procambarus clarkii]XP_045587578.1 probable RNA-binding protein CG14230 [Procambarus clarki